MANADAEFVVDIQDAEITMGGHQHLIVPRFLLSKGAVAIILGPNGCGKSTFGRSLCGIHGSEKRSFAKWEVMMPTPVMTWQSLNLFPTSVEKNVKIVSSEFAEVALKYVDLWPRRRDSADVLSGGERQRLAIVRSMVASANVLVLDEPTSSLDTSYIENLVDLIAVFSGQRSPEDERENWITSSRVISDMGSVVVITHDLRFVRRLCHLTNARIFSVTQSRKIETDRTTYHLSGGANGLGFDIKTAHRSPSDLFVADFFGLPNIIGFTGIREYPRSAEDLCSRYFSPVDGWIILKDQMINIFLDQDGSSRLLGKYRGWEYSGTQARRHIEVHGRYGVFTITVPMEMCPKSHGEDCDGAEVYIAIDISNRSGWSLLR